MRRRSGVFFNPKANPLGLQSPKVLPLVHGYADRVPVQAIRGLLHSPILGYVALDSTLRTHAKKGSSEGPTVDSLNALSAIGAHLLHEEGYEGLDVTVAIFDSGINGHATLAMTMKYTHLAPDHRLKAIRILDSALQTDTKTDTPHISGSDQSL